MIPKRVGSVKFGNFFIEGVPQLLQNSLHMDLKINGILIKVLDGGEFRMI